jgi:hypothetical protein
MTHGGFGRIPSPYDPKDYELKTFIHRTAESEQKKEKSWKFPSTSLDQFDTGHCVGFSMANFGINYPTHTKFTNADGHNFYYLCKIKDGQPKMENGSDIRSAAKVLKDLKIIEGYAWAKTIDEVKYWLLNKGPMIVGTDWTEGMDNPDANNIVRASGKVLGGHAYLLNEWTKDNLIGIQNSWDDRWGKNGKAYIPAKDFEYLLKRWGGEALTAVEIEHSISVPKADPNAKFNLIAFIQFLGSILGKLFDKN